MIPVELRDSYSLEDVKAALKGMKFRIYPGKGKRIRHFTPYDQGLGSSISFLNPGMETQIKQSLSQMFITSKKVKTEKTLIVTPNPRLAFMKILNYCMGIKPTETHIHKDATVKAGAYIGEGVVIEPGARIGVARISDNCFIGCNTFIGDNVYIGRNVTIGANTSIGVDGYGYEWDGKKHEKFMSIGNVYIGDGVDIGSNVSIARGTLSDTIIYNGVKIDNLVHIAHNVEIGEHSKIIANSMIGGSVKIGRNVHVAPSVTIINKVTIGDNAVLGIGSNILKNVPKSETWIGNPARKLR